MREGVGSFCPYCYAKWSLWGGGRNFRKEPEYRAKIGKYGEKLCQGRKKRDSGAKGAQIRVLVDESGPRFSSVGREACSSMCV